MNATVNGSTHDGAGLAASRAIVVGVTGRGRETPALAFAADCARREGLPVLLVHAFRNTLPAPPPSVLLTHAEVGQVAEAVVHEVAEELEELTGGTVKASTLTLAGKPSRALIELGHDASLIVVQHRSWHAPGHLFVGSTVNGAAAHADCPVVSVPPDWRPVAATDGGPGEVVVGVHERGVPHQVLEAGFAWAADTGAPVRVVHGWRLDAGYDDIITARVAAEWREEQKQALSTAVAGLRESHPSVPVELEVRHQWPAEVLVDCSRTASLVVVGRRGPHGWVGEHLGSVARTVLRAAESPVMVVPVRPEQEAPHA
jgi:nucleotide-binding universal stress UspA family protein